MDCPLEQQIRDAAASGEFGRALALWQQHAAWLRDRIEAGQATEAEMQTAIELVRSVTATAGAARAQAAGQLRESRVSSAYEALARRNT